MAIAGTGKIAQLVIEMAMEAAPFIVGTQLVSSSTARMSDDIEQSAGRIDKLTSSITRFTKAALGIASVTAAMGKGISRAAQNEAAEASFKTMLARGTQHRLAISGARELMGQVRTMAKETPFEMPELLDGSRRLLAFGVAGDQVTNTLRRIGDVSAGVQSRISEVADIYGKAKVQGRLFAEDYNQFTGRGIQLANSFAKQLGVTSEEIPRMVALGRVNFKHLEQAFVDLTAKGGAFFNLSEDQSKITMGSFAAMKDSVNTSLELMGYAFLKASGASEIMKSIENAFETLIPEFQTFGRILGWIISPISILIEKVTQYHRAIALAVVGVKLLTLAMHALMAVLIILITRKVIWWTIATAAVWARAALGVIGFSKAIWMVVKALNSAVAFQVMLISLSGPKGWLALAASATAFAGILTGIYRTMDAIMKSDVVNGYFAGSLSALSPEETTAKAVSPELQQMAMQVKKELLTAAQIYQQTVYELRVLLSEGLLNKDQFKMAIAQAEQTRRQNDAGDSLIDTLKRELAIFGMTAEQIAIYDAKLKGATASQVTHIQRLQRMIAAREAEVKAIEDAKRAEEELQRDRERLIQRNLNPFQKYIEAMQEINRLLPTSLGRHAERMQAIANAQDQFRKSMIDSHGFDLPGAVDARSAQGRSVGVRNQQSRALDKHFQTMVAKADKQIQKLDELVQLQHDQKTDQVAVFSN